MKCRKLRLFARQITTRGSKMFDILHTIFVCFAFYGMFRFGTDAIDVYFALKERQ